MVCVQVTPDVTIWFGCLFRDNRAVHAWVFGHRQCCGFLDNGAELFATPIVERNQDLICDTHEVNGEDIPGNIIDSDLSSINVQTTQLRTLFLS
jgi:hypothetical protein